MPGMPASLSQNGAEQKNFILVTSETNSTGILLLWVLSLTTNYDPPVYLLMHLLIYSYLIILFINLFINHAFSIQSSYYLIHIQTD